jgi:uncharacterized protein
MNLEASLPPKPVQIEVSPTVQVSGLWQVPVHPRACYVLAHGAGAGMNHPFMASMAAELQTRDIATLRFQFPYVERGSRRPDPEALCHDTVRAAVLKAAELAPALPRFAGGKSFGGRMTSQAQAASPLPGVRGLGFLGFPLHPAGRPSDTRATHLSDVKVPMLFLQGTRDDLADLTLLQPVIDRLGTRATLELIEGADHSYHVRASAGVTDAQIRAVLAQKLCEWMQRVSGMNPESPQLP